MIEFRYKAVSFCDVKVEGKDEKQILDYMKEEKCSMEEALFDLEVYLGLFDEQEFKVYAKEVIDLSFSEGTTRCVICDHNAPTDYVDLIKVKYKGAVAFEKEKKLVCLDCELKQKHLNMERHGGGDG